MLKEQRQSIMVKCIDTNHFHSNIYILGKSISQFNGAKIFIQPYQPKVKSETETETETGSKENTPSNSIFVSGIPTNISQYDLYRALTSLFMDIGHIKVISNRRKNI